MSFHWLISILGIEKWTVAAINTPWKCPLFLTVSVINLGIFYGIGTAIVSKTLDMLQIIPRLDQ